MKNVTIYSKPQCPYCVKAKQLFDSLGVEYTDIDVLENPEKRAEVSEKYNWYTVPMIFIGDEFVGGSDDVHKLHAEGKLLPLLDTDYTDFK